MQRNTVKASKSKFPRYMWICYGIAALSLVIYLIAVISTSFAAFFNDNVGAVVRAFLACLTSWLPFSLSEILIYCIPVVIAMIGVWAWRRHCESWRSMFRYLLCILSVASLFFSLFVFSFGTGYHTETLDRRLGIETCEVSSDDLKNTAMTLVTALHAVVEEIDFGEDGFSVMPYDIGTLNDKLLEAYGVINADYHFIQTLDSRIKPVLASKLMSYTHITGVYSYYTGEANLNIYFPDYTLPFTAAHELAHQRGIARENEANFIAFLVTKASDDPYIRYCAYLNMYEYVASALYGADTAAYKEVVLALPAEVIGELRAYAAFFEQFRGSTISKVSDAMNDTYLKLNGNEEGTASYGLVVDLTVAYYKDIEKSRDHL